MTLDIKKWTPWNWFKDEENQEGGDVRASEGERGGRSFLPAAFTNDPLWNIHREVDRLFHDAFSQVGTGLPRLFGKTGLERFAGGLLKPNVDIKETKKNYKITVEVPGVAEDDIKLELADGALTVSGEKKDEKEEEDENYHSIERSYGSFRRVLSLPADADADQIEARFKNGILTVTVPRKEAGQSGDGTKVIDIKSAA